ncbi:MAG: tRNA (guanosine(46)-N7)-methyltransferase TrmB [Treponemataceae bacterium]
MSECSKNEVLEDTTSYDTTESSCEEETTTQKFYRTIRTFVLREGRMTEKQNRDYQTLSGKWRIPYVSSTLNFVNIFNNTNPIVIEIGFGMGHATAKIAQENPHINYIGIEVHRPGVGRLLGEINTLNLHNLYIIEHDALEVLTNMIPDNAISAFHIFFPDPWPKKKHHKRRLLKRPNTTLLAQKLSAQGYVYMTTDWQPYAEFALEELCATDELENMYQSFAPKQEWRPKTNFENKGLLAQREILELYFKKRSINE